MPSLHLCLTVLSLTLFFILCLLLFDNSHPDCQSDNMFTTSRRRKHIVGVLRDRETRGRHRQRQRTIQKQGQRTRQKQTESEAETDTERYSARQRVETSETRPAGNFTKNEQYLCNSSFSGLIWVVPLCRIDSVTAMGGRIFLVIFFRGHSSSKQQIFHHYPVNSTLNCPYHCEALHTELGQLIHLH